MKISILFGGEAGQGPNILTHILGESLVKQGYYVFYSRDYQSLIRGGHNFNVLTFSDEHVNSNESKIDVLVCLDENTEKIHKKDLKKNGIILNNKHNNMYFAGKLFKILGLDFKILENELKILKKRFDENLKESKQGYEDTEKSIELPKSLNKKSHFMNGNQGLANGAIKSGLDIYYAYPMTPATAVLGELAKNQIENNHLVIELENEISVINAGIGSAITGAKTMIGTSGGGFDLMTEGLSLAGIAEAPLVIYLSQRPGPGTGVATYTAQGDLNIVRHAGHGEFPRLVVAGGDPGEILELTNQAFYFSQKFKIPSIIMSDKHLAESLYTVEKEPKIIKCEKSTELKRYNSYETDNQGSATEDSEIIKFNTNKRIKKQKEIEKHAEKFEQYKTYGKNNSKNIILGWGSTKGAILDAIKGTAPCSSKMSDDLKKSSKLQEASEAFNKPSKGAIINAIKDLDCKFIQILYIEPFPEKIKKELENKNIILVENNSTAQLGNLIAEKTGIFIEDKNKILRYDGRPFLCDELKKEIKGRLR